MKLRVGLVGVGQDWESRHRPALKSLSDRFDVRAICSEVAARAEQVAVEFDATVIDGFRALTARKDVDAVLVLSPDWYGPIPILAACDEGKAVYCAAALDIAPEQAQQVRRRVEESGVAFMAEFARRYSAATIRLKELIATRLGPPQLLFCHLRRPQKREDQLPTDSGHPPAEQLHGGKPPHGNNGAPFSRAVRDLIELVDWCRYIVGTEPTSVVGVDHQVAGEEDYQAMSLDFSSLGETGDGPLAQISCGTYFADRWPAARNFRPPAELQVCCERGVAFVDLPSTLVWFDQAGQHRESLEDDRPVGEQLLTHFHRAVTSLVRKTTDLDDAYRALNIVLSAQTSVQEGRRITLSD